ncbi:polysaccharide deacetylase family protein [Actinocorallia populi]|uniref:polysaccharide deacetylase family protein n=1 Tax=Actinocorallia populi TaxID=2079200 RepID=UPI001E28DE26|nr:polysaccharide deacetylase family protein [Actinocorallia populi]
MRWGRRLAIGVAGLMGLMLVSGGSASDAHRIEWTWAEKKREAERPKEPLLPPLPTLPPTFERPKTDCRKLRCVALTFDDGPGPDTERLLDMLARAKAKATFFVIGLNAAQYPDVLLRVAEEGHEVGNHTQKHLQLTSEPDKAVDRELDATNRAIKSVLGFPPTLFRPPYGATDKRVERHARDDGMAVILWSVDTNDWENRDSGVVARRAVKGLRRGSIILMHDIHPTSVDAVPRILEAARRKGLTLASVSDVLAASEGVKKPKPGKKYLGR